MIGEWKNHVKNTSLTHDYCEIYYWWLPTYHMRFKTSPNFKEEMSKIIYHRRDVSEK